MAVPPGLVAMALAMVAINGAYIGTVWLLGALSRPVPPRGLRPAIRWWARHRAARKPPVQPLPPVLLGLELRRLGHEVARVEADTQPAKAARLAAMRTAYDSVLLDYCRLVAVPVPTESLPLTGEERLEAELALIGRGHDW
jgi:hypothetical protein